LDYRAGYPSLSVLALLGERIKLLTPVRTIDRCLELWDLKRITTYLCLDPLTAVAIPKPKYTVPET
jgi:hypothetical protein